MSSPRASPAPSTPPAPSNATSPPPAATAPPPVATSPPPSVPSPPAPVVTPPPSVSPPAPVTPATPPPADSPPSTPSSPPPPSSTPSSPPPPSSSPSPPSPPSSTPSPPGRSSPPPPSGRRSPPPPPPHTPTPATPSSNGGGGSSSVSTPMVVGIAIAAVAVLAVLSLIFIFCRKKKRRGYPPHDYLGPPPGPKVDPYGGQGYQWQNNAPPPGNHQWQNNAPPPGSMPPKLNPPPGGASRPPHSPYMSSGGSNYSGSENIQNLQPPPPPPSAGMAYGFAKSMFTYEELARATDGFSEANLLGQGGFGYVHRGILPKEGTEVAIKQLKAGSGQGEREFQAEVEIISRVHHKHLVTLVGYCMTGLQRLLVYEFVPNNTLEFHLHGKGRPPLDWSTRMKIALGSAKGLAYLHEDCHPKIIHRDIKAANILIDFSFEAKVADFGLAKLTSDLNTHISTRVMGTFGYLAPEYASSGKLTEKSDVFSFGVVLLEMITGHRPVDSFNGAEDSLVDWARPLLLRAVQEDDYSSLVDPRLLNNFNRNEMARVVGLANACVNHVAKKRPRMSLVVRVLEGDVLLSDLSDGTRPGHGSLYSSHGSSDYDTVQYQEDIKKMRKTALADSSEYGATSEYGLNPSGSSSEAATTREMIMGKVKKDNNSP